MMIIIIIILGFSYQFALIKLEHALADCERKAINKLTATIRFNKDRSITSSVLILGTLDFHYQFKNFGYSTNFRYKENKNKNLEQSIRSMVTTLCSSL